MNSPESADTCEERALALIDPVVEREPNCRAQLLVNLQLLKEIEANRSKSLSPGEFRSGVDDVATVMRKATATLRALPPTDRYVLFRIYGSDGTPPLDEATFVRNLEHMEKAARLIADRMHVPAGAPVHDATKQAAAGFAFDLLQAFAKVQPSPVGRNCLELASVLYEAATGAIGADLTRYCRVHDEVFPTHVLNFPNVRS